MAEFNILSWNVESFGEKKVDKAANFIAAVIHEYKVGLVFFLETDKRFQSLVVAALAELLGEQWQSITSDETGKSRDLPAKILFSKFPKACDRKAYESTLKLCYDVNAKSYDLKTTYSEDDEETVRSALVLAGILRVDQETYTGFVNYDKVDWSSRAYLLPNSLVGVSLLGCQLRSTDAAGTELGYQNEDSEFNGRMPFITQMFSLKKSDPKKAESWFPVVSFHAPFGKNESIRVPAVSRLLKLGTRATNGSGEANVEALGCAIVMGDFNIDFDRTKSYDNLPKPIPNTYSKSQQAYGPFVQEGFTIHVKEASSLVKNGQKTWTKSTDFRSSAYDNIMTKGIPSTVISKVGVLDLIADIEDSCKINHYLQDVIDVNISSAYSAFQYYRKQISDHLPVLIKMQVADRP